MNIILMGPQGSGKGTQAKLISDKYNFPHIGTGDILREALKNKTELGLKAKKYMDKGELVPDGVMIGIIKERLKKDDCKEGYILDGFPRTLDQAKALEKITNVDIVVHIEVSDKEAIKRISKRRVCECGQVYHLIYNPPEEDMLCDKCGKKLYQRDDDKEESVKKRLELYHKETKLVLDFYRNEGILVEVDGEQSIEEVFEDIVEELEHE